jgi:ankyrin repeat protein
LADAVGYGMLAAARRLVERGAAVDVWNAAAMGMLPLLQSLLEAAPPPSLHDVNVAFWGACAEGELACARLLTEHGAEVNWPAPWSGETPLDVAINSHQDAMVTWLREQGAHARRSQG